MESLSTACTPLKHRYDSCFNAWFEGYLQPALDAGVTPPAHVVHPPPDPAQGPSPVVPRPASSRLRPITTWASALGRRTPAPEPSAPAVASPSDQPPFPLDMLPPIDTAGKTRPQIKAEEYKRACGHAWKEYQSCLQRAIGYNQNLSTLLEQSRGEHPLGSLNGLQGTPWDGHSYKEG